MNFGWSAAIGITLVLAAALVFSVIEAMQQRQPEPFARMWDGIWESLVEIAEEPNCVEPPDEKETR